MAYTIVLKDGTTLEGLELNGNCYVSETEIDESKFEDNTSTVEVSDGETVETLKDVVYQRCASVDGRHWFILREKTEKEQQSEDITNLEEALAEVYEMIIG